MRAIRRILCPVDFTEVSNRELELATRLAGRFNAELILQHNIASGSALGVSWMHDQEHHQQAVEQERHAREQLTALLAALPAGVHPDARGALTYGILHRSVQTLAEEATVDLIVIGTHGRPTADHQSETERLITHAPCPVLTIHDNAPQTSGLAANPAPVERLRTLVPVDFSEHSLAALRYALELREPLALDITVLYVPASDDYGTGWAEAKLSEALPASSRPLFQLEVKQGKPVEQILDEETALDSGLVVMGSHAAGFIERLFFRGPPTSREVLHRSRCPVWFVPASVQTA